MSEVVPAHGGARTDRGSSETPCIYCPHEVKYIIDFSRSVNSPEKRGAWKAAFLNSHGQSDLREGYLDSSYPARTSKPHAWQEQRKGKWLGIGGAKRTWRRIALELGRFTSNLRLIHQSINLRQDPRRGFTRLLVC